MLIKVDPDRIAPAPVPRLTFAQLLFGLVSEGWITHAEADNWLVHRVLPAPLDAAISSLPPEQQILVKARALQPAEVVFTDPVVQAMGATQGRPPEEMAAFFRKYAQV